MEAIACTRTGRADTLDKGALAPNFGILGPNFGIYENNSTMLRRGVEDP